MIYPIKVERSAHGWWSHPAWDALCGDREMISMDEVQAWLDHHRLEISTELFEGYELEDGSPRPGLEDWPLQPPGEAWFLLAVGDSEDGYFQHWARHKTPFDAIAAERLRQVEAEGWSPAHDDEHRGGEMPLAAAAYAYRSSCHNPGDRVGVPALWPWDRTYWKPTTARRNLIKAAALIVAELERLDRAEAAAAKGR